MAKQDEVIPNELITYTMSKAGIYNGKVVSIAEGKVCPISVKLVDLLQIVAKQIGADEVDKEDMNRLKALLNIEIAKEDKEQTKDINL